MLIDNLRAFRMELSYRLFDCLEKRLLKTLVELLVYFSFVCTECL